MRTALLLLGVVLSGPAFAESYLCIPDRATGFVFNPKSKTWSNANFSMTDKYILRKPSKDDVLVPQDTKWLVMKIGESYPVATCDAEINKIGNLFCDGFQLFKFSKKNMRFISAYLFGFWSDDVGKSEGMFAEGANSPVIEIGRCSLI